MYRLVAGHRILGVIELISRKPREPSPELFSRLALLGTELGYFVERRTIEEERLAAHEALRLQTWWSGRSAPAEKALQELNGGRPFGELSPQERTRVGEAFEEGYRNQFRRANLDEMLAQLRAFFHLG